MKLKIYSELEGIPPIFYSPVFEFPQYFNFEMDLPKADYLAIPIYWEVIYDYTPQEFQKANVSMDILQNLTEKVSNLIHKAHTYNKPILIFFYRDPIEKIPVKNAIVFRTSILKSDQDKNVFAFPAFKTDIQKDFIIDPKNIWIKKTKKPKIGFRGRATSMTLPFVSRIKEKWNGIATYFSIPFHFSTGWIEGYSLRKKAILNLLKNSNVEMDYAIINDDPITETEKKISHQLFCDNIILNQYNICVKGHGNYSYRFYETLSAGRIPIFINTDCALPYDFILEWKNYCIWIESKDIDKIDQKVLEFHNKFSEEEFIQLQKDIRKLWETWISPEGFIKNLYKHFDNNSELHKN